MRKQTIIRVFLGSLLLGVSGIFFVVLAIIMAIPVIARAAIGQLAASVGGVLNTTACQTRSG